MKITGYTVHDTGNCIEILTFFNMNVSIRFKSAVIIETLWGINIKAF